MCKTQKYVSTTCCHDWFEITDPCGKDKNFDKCEGFADGHLRPPRSPPSIRLPKKCPECDGKDKYDGKMVRMVKEVRHGTVCGGDEWIDYGRGRRELRPRRSEVQWILCTVM